jgi:tRNA-binding EMAP/Myf-like protein
MRNLASIQKILNITPILNSDNLELLTVLGWHVVVQKEEFNVGDLCVYCEIDSLLPERPEFEFLRKVGFRIKTARIRGVLSQGICFPLSILPEGIEVKEEMDVTEVLGVVKYEPAEPACLSGDAKGKFPPFIVKSDETRCIHGDTVLITDLGSKTIREICENKILCKILSYNHDNDIEDTDEIIDHKISKNINNWFKITFNDGNYLYLTDDHPVFLPNINAYREVKRLKIGDYLIKTEHHQI